MIVARSALAIVVLGAATLSQGAWHRTYGGQSADIGRCVRQTPDAGYVLAGHTRSRGAGGDDVWLIRTDSAGDTLWSRTFGDTLDDYADEVEQTLDGGYILVGSSLVEGRSFDIRVIKTDAAGSEEWHRTYGGEGLDEGRAVEQTIDGGFVIAGGTTSPDSMGFDACLIKLDAAGEQVWFRRYGTNRADYAQDVKQTVDGKYVAAGATRDRKAWLFKTDAEGGLVWDTAFGGANDSKQDRACAVHQTPDGGYIVGATKIPLDAHYNKSDFWLIKTDAHGNEEWNTVIGDRWASHDYAYDAIRTSDGGYAITGHTQPNNVSDGSVWLVRTDAGGSVLIDTNLYAATSAYSLVETRDGAYALLGVNAFDSSGIDIVLIKTVAHAHLAARRPVPGPAHRAPFRVISSSRGVIIECTRATRPAFGVDIYDPRGRLTKEPMRPADPASLLWRSGSSGMRLVRIRTRDGVYTAGVATIR